jgi:alpha-beta hydrolase superfamily lysophospholipase
MQTGVRRGRLRWVRRALTALVAVALAASCVIAWTGSSALLTPHHSLSTPAGTVVSIGGGSVVLQRMETTERVGTYGLVWNGGTATIGPIASSDADTVTRPISDVVGTLTAGTAVQLNPNIWMGDPESSLGIPFQNVTVDGPLGAMPAWKVDGTGSTWVLFVHGIDGSREGGLRPLPTLVAAGLPTLLITYRNDVGAPPSPSGLISLGQNEWQDLDAAAAYAVQNGATHFVLYGDSMGGSIVTRFIHESSYASRVVGMVLDSPVLNWAGVLQGQADRFHLGILGGPLQVAVSVRGGIDLADLDELEQSNAFTMPILLFQGLSDKLVPPAESALFAQEAGPQVKYVPVPDAGHIQSWNVDPAAYESTLAQFLRPFSPATTTLP